MRGASSECRVPGLGIRSHVPLILVPLEAAHSPMLYLAPWAFHFNRAFRLKCCLA